MATLKIVFIAGEKQTVLYAQGMKQMWQVESHVLERLGQAERQALAEAQFRKYWIDEENDRVDIINDADFDFFLKRSHSQKTPKIYFEARVPPKETQTTGQKENVQPTKPNQDNLSIHPTVECDVCLKAPIRGYRYKCLQCPNFDLCMKCESEMKHTEHLMLRIPHADSPKLETVCPMTSIFGGKTARRQQKQAARAAASANAAAEGSGGDGKSRHHRHHRKHCSGGAGLLSNFYDMMQDLAEGGVPQENPETPQKQTQKEASAPPQLEKPFEAILAAAKVAAATAAKEASTAAASAAAAAAASSAASASATTSMSSSHTSSTSASAAGGMSKETNTSPDRMPTSTAGAQTTPTGSIPITPSLENLIDPQFMKAGIQILNNFSEMFGKILDPVVTEGGSRSSSAPEYAETNIDLTCENGASGTPPPTAAETPNMPAGSNLTSNAGSGIVTPMETETSAAVQAPAPESSQPRSRNSQSEENDWTMIDSNVVTISDVPSADPTTAPAAPIDFAKLSQQLQSHIENEMKSVSFEIHSPTSSVTPPQVAAPTVPNVAPIPAPAAAVASAPAPAPTLTSAPAAAPAPAPTSAPAAAPVAPAPEITERRAIAVFHADPRINSAVHGMMAMGFSNEGAVLTQLLESVNGSIPLALDLMSAAQRN